MAINGSAFTAPIEMVPQQQGLGDKIISRIKSTADTISSLKTIWDLGKAGFEMAKMIPPIAV